MSLFEEVISGAANRLPCNAVIPKWLIKWNQRGAMQVRTIWQQSMKGSSAQKDKKLLICNI